MTKQPNNYPDVLLVDMVIYTQETPFDVCGYELWKVTNVLKDVANQVSTEKFPFGYTVDMRTQETAILIAPTLLDLLPALVFTLSQSGVSDDELSKSLASLSASFSVQSPYEADESRNDVKANPTISEDQTKALENPPAGDDGQASTSNADNSSLDSNPPEEKPKQRRSSKPNPKGQP